jgi:hypothetical protein
MNEQKKGFKRAPMLAAILSLAMVSIAVVKTTGQDAANPRYKVAIERWEYLAVAGPSATNLTATGTPSMRKESAVPFGREALCWNSTWTSSERTVGS